VNRRLLDRILTYFLIVTVIVTVGALLYVIDHPVEEKFTECGILGPEGKAAGYPVEFLLSGNKVVQVGYEGDGGYIRIVKENYGRVIVQIVNREQRDVNYRLEVWINGEKAKLWLSGLEKDDTGLLALKQGEKWEQVIGFAPQSTSDKEKVEFVLYKDGQPYFPEPPRLWVSVKPSA
jgi:uncharacterized membrane protein